MRHLRLGVRLQGGSNSLPRAVPYLSLGRLGRCGVRLCHHRRGGCADELEPHHQVKRRTADFADAGPRRALPPATVARRATATVRRRAAAAAVLVISGALRLYDRGATVHQPRSSGPDAWSRASTASHGPPTAHGVERWPPPFCIAAGHAPRPLRPRAPPTAATRAPAAAPCWAAPSTSWWASSKVARAPSAARGTPAAAFTQSTRTATTSSTFTYRTYQPYAGGFKILDQGRPRRTAPLQHVQVEAARAGAGWALRVRSFRTFGADAGGVTHANGTELLCSLLRQH